MLTISQLAAIAGVTTRRCGIITRSGCCPSRTRCLGLPRYGATAVLALIKIRTLANAACRCLRSPSAPADAAAFAAQSSGSTTGCATRPNGWRPAAGRSRNSRPGQPAGPTGGGLLFDRLRQIGTSERIVQGERDGSILVAARWPNLIPESMPTVSRSSKTRAARLYRFLLEIAESDGGDNDDPRLVERRTSWPTCSNRRTRRQRNRPTRSRATTCRSTSWTHSRSSPTRGWSGCSSSCASVAGRRARLERLEKPPG